MTEEPQEPAPEPAQEPTEEPEPTQEPQDPEADPEGPEEPATPEEPPAEAPVEAPASPVTFEALTKADKRLEGAVKRYIDQVEDYATSTGQKFYRVGIDLPGLPGFIFDPMDKPLDEEQIRGAQMLLGMEIEPPLLGDPLAVGCYVCDGYGSVLTGSKVKGERIATCNECDGHGFTGERLDRIRRSGGAPLSVVNASAPAPVTYETPRDQWGTPLGHPGYGTPPDRWPLEYHEQLRTMMQGVEPYLNAVGA